MKKVLLTGFLAVLSTLTFPSFSQSQSVSVGSGSYSTVLPPGAIGPRQANGTNAIPKVSSTFAKPVQTNEFWSSLIFPFFGDPHSNVLHAHPLNFLARQNGLEMGYSPNPTFVANDYVHPYTQQLTVGVAELNASSTLTHDYGDWTVTALWQDGSRSLKATLGHGLPFAFFTVEGGNASISTSSNPTIWHNQNGVIGLTIAGIHYGIFAPHGSSWTGTSTLQSNLNGQNYLTVALLPNNSPATLEFFRKRAYAHVTDSQVEWSYNETTAQVTTTFTYQVDLKEDINNNLSQTLSALYRHQWLNSNDPLTEFSYSSRAGTMKLFDGNTFTTEVTFDGVLPTLPDLGVINRADLLAMVKVVASENLGAGPTYENGKAIGRFARLVHIADQLGANAERDHFLNQIRNRLENWLSVGGGQEYSYNATWNVLTGYPSGFGADDQINDHSFHSGYAIMGAATVAQYDPEWASQERWGGMVNLLIRDSNNWERHDERFPFLRNHDPYAGHSWAAGHADFRDGNNQESSSESMHFSTAVILWGTMTNQPEIRDLGIYLHATERTAVEQYWFDVDNAVFPASYPHVAVGIVWGGKGTHSTWFGNAPEFIHGINFLPITGGSLYLGRHPDYVLANYAEIEMENSGPPDIWPDVLWEFLALADPDRAMSEFLANPNYPIFDGESKAHTYHWIANLKRIGQKDTTVTADVPTYAAFRNNAGIMSYTAFNAQPDSTDVLFSDGFVLRVGPRSMGWKSLVEVDSDTPIALLSVSSTSGKSPMTVEFSGRSSYDPNNSELTFVWTFGDGNTSDEVSPTHVYEDPGTYEVTMRVTNDLDNSAEERTEITVMGNGTPFLSEAPTIPGRIEAEHFDLGGQGVAYYDVDPQNVGRAFRPDEWVDIEPSSTDNYNIYWMVASEWLEYTIHVPEDGLYDIIPYLTSVPGFGNFRILFNNIDVSGKRYVPGTGGWQNWTPFPVENVNLKAGTQIMRFEVDSDTDKQNWLYSLDYIDIKKSEGTSTVEPEQIVRSFSLDQNYPNPFNPVTTIGYSIPEAMPVLIEVFASSGERVATLVRSEMPVGTHSVSFDASNLASGLYIYRISTPAGTFSRKMTLIK